MLTQKRLKQLLSYYPDTGDFTWLKYRNYQATIGQVAGYKNKEGYIVICIDNKIHLAHRLAWLYIHGEWPQNQIDHINGVRHNNKINNLRLATNQENQKNRKLQKNNKSGITGVIWYKQTNRWMARLQHNSKNVHLGFYKDKFEAICARKSAEIKYEFHENHGRK